ncbi:MAG: OmpA family protein [Eubacterium sp.]
MKNLRIRLSLVAIMVTVILGLAGCGSKEYNNVENGKPAVAYMIANTANARSIDSSAPMVQDTMMDCAESYGYSFIVRVDGEPEIVSSVDLDIDAQFKNASKERLARDACNKATNLLGVLDDVKAEYPEVDYLEGLRCAAASLRSLDDGYTSRSIICCGTGLGTTGYLDFKNNLLSAETQVIIEMLKEREAIPDLTGITVYWLGMGQVSSPQNKLTPKQTKNLQDIWQAVVEAAGGEFVPNDYITVDSEKEEEKQLPSVSVVDISSDKPIVFESKVLEDDGEKQNAFEEPIMLGENQVKFISDASNYLNPDDAVAIIRPIAEYLVQHNAINLLLIGTTAGDKTDESSLRLSQERADAVKKTLIEHGVGTGRITTLGS